MNSENNKQSFFQLDLISLQDYFKKIGEPPYRTEQVWSGVYQDLFSEWNEFTNLPKSLRSHLDLHFSLNSLVPITTRSSPDNKTRKILFHLSDGKPVESVLMRGGERFTLCLSTQSGCAMGCTFCATGKLGLLKNLTHGEIIEQVIYCERLLKKNSQLLTNIVFMGMGEPFHNYENVIRSINLLNNPAGLNLGSRRFTVSTIGLIPQILKFAHDTPQVNLAISLHAANDELRTSLVPMNKLFPLKELIPACHAYIKQTNRRITFEYVLIEKVNDDPKQASELVNLIKGLLCHVNLIPMNPVEKSPQNPSSIIRINAFSKILTSCGIPTTIRKSQGSEINAGCGQLAGKE